MFLEITLGPVQRNADHRFPSEVQAEIELILDTCVTKKVLVEIQFVELLTGQEIRNSPGRAVSRFAHVPENGMLLFILAPTLL